MKKTVKICAITAVAAAIGATALIAGGCSIDGYTEEFSATTALCNGGFESSDLSGWTVEYGDAFDDDSVASADEFSFAYDPEQNKIPVNQTGNWYLSGKAYDGKRPHGYTGSIRSEVFTLGGDCTISMKLAGGALVVSKGEGAAKKSPEKTCYVGVYTADDDKMVAKFTNKYFLEHTASYVNVDSYKNGTYCTDNFYTYSENLSEYYGKQMYIRIVDNDTDKYYGYISVDDIRIGGASAQTEGEKIVKTRDFTTEAVAPSKYEIANGGFESGSLAGWTVLRGDAFSNDGVNNVKYWWDESISYDRDGNYHYGHYKPTATGAMRSSEFVLGGSGYISYKLGGCKNNAATYLAFYVKTDDGDKKVAQFSNYKFDTIHFPYIQNGTKALNLVQYYADFSEYLGKIMYIEAVDDNASSDDLGCMTLDSVQTYYKEKPVWYDSLAFEARPDPDLYDIAPDSPHQVQNGTFETGDLTGWEMTGDIGEVSNASGWWAENYPYNKKGAYLFTGIAKEPNTGALTSSAFTLGGTGDITFRLGGGGNPAKCYVSVIDADTEEELVRFANLGFSDVDYPSGMNKTTFLANMISYRANLVDMGVEFGRNIKLRITDNADANWGLITADSFITYYESASHLPKNAVEAKNIKPAPVEENEYNIVNGGFETGDMTGWTVVGDGKIDGVASGDVFWNEKIPYNNGGLMHFDGWKATANEADTYAIRSTTFTLGGSGFISFKMAGRSAKVRVYRAGETPELIAEYANTAFSENPFPFVDNGCRCGTMTTFFADLRGHEGEKLFVELCDAQSETGEDGKPLNWGFAFFDDIVTYHESAPTTELFDTVELNAKTSATGVTTFDIHWVEAVNVLEKQEN